MVVIPAARPARPRRWPGVVAWTLWALAMVVCLVIGLWLDRLLRQAGRPDLVQWDARPGVAVVTTATVGAVLASRRPQHPVGWLLLAQTVSLLAIGAAAQYLARGLLGRPEPLPATRHVALYYPASAGGGLILLGFVLLLTPTGKLPSPRWRWWARVMVAVPVMLLLVVTLAPGPVDPYRQVLGSPFDFHGLGGVLLVINQLALAFTTLTLVVGAWSLVIRFRRARGVERQQLRWVAVGAALLVPAALVVLAGLALGASDAVTWALSAWLAGLPLAIGAAVLRYRLYDLDRIVSRTLAYGLLTLLLGGGYAGVVLGLGQLLGRDTPWWWPAPPWRSPRCSSRPAAASSRQWTAASTAAATTPCRRSRRSAPGCGTRSTWTPFRRSCWRSSTRRCSRPRRGCGRRKQVPSRPAATQVANDQADAPAGDRLRDDLTARPRPSHAARSGSGDGEDDITPGVPLHAATWCFRCGGVAVNSPSGWRCNRQPPSCTA